MGIPAARYGEIDYAVRNKQYIVVAVNGEQKNNFKGGYIAFAIQ